MKKRSRYLLLKRSILKRILSLFSLSAVAFVFQACYGTLEGYEYTHIEGYVIEAGTNNPIAGIKVALDSVDIDTTKADGSFWFNVPVNDRYSLQFTDIDDTNNGHFIQKVIELENADFRTYLTSNVSLESY
jgi:hypothetical protein